MIAYSKVVCHVIVAIGKINIKITAKHINN